VIGTEVTYVITTILLRLSIGFTFHRLTTSHTQRRWILFILAISTSISFSFLVFLFNQCGPISSWRKFENRFIRSKCQARPVTLAVNFVHSLVNALTDIACAWIPGMAILNTEFPRREKLHALIAFVLATLYVSLILSLTNMSVNRVLT
jgi:hypothetical protein